MSKLGHLCNEEKLQTHQKLWDDVLEVSSSRPTVVSA